jgi:hypothetical protein
MRKRKVGTLVGVEWQQSERASERAREREREREREQEGEEEGDLGAFDHFDEEARERGGARNGGGVPV